MVYTVTSQQNVQERSDFLYEEVLTYCDPGNKNLILKLKNSRAQEVWTYFCRIPLGQLLGIATVYGFVLNLVYFIIL